MQAKAKFSFPRSSQEDATTAVQSQPPKGVLTQFPFVQSDERVVDPFPVSRCFVPQSDPKFSAWWQGTGQVLFECSGHEFLHHCLVSDAENIGYKESLTVRPGRMEAEVSRRDVETSVSLLAVRLVGVADDRPRFQQFRYVHRSGTRKISQPGWQLKGTCVEADCHTL